ncbi:hypothetical protein CY34DRAFT_539170 [Suillus luteus UH-Slu-Lm8-n1]|uniref:Uncharacterized protein n=1 Tax=Suillus luteus UH-Slu-Lm8-n1 TaxID=930992 RepID=A0A0D0A357_9AGAM|nr:hypothetical protein CY34DRAFT_539170 [Suillus luteus UH-Slu-Lm8-n1]
MEMAAVNLRTYHEMEAAPRDDSSFSDISFRHFVHTFRFLLYSIRSFHTLDQSTSRVLALRSVFFVYDRNFLGSYLNLVVFLSLVIPPLFC